MFKKLFLLLGLAFFVAGCAALPADFSDGNIFTADAANSWKDTREGTLLPIDPTSLNYEDADNDLGSATYRWRDGYFSRDLVVGDDLVVTDDVTIIGKLTVDTNTLYVDDSSNKIGVGTSNPTSEMHLVDSDSFILLVETTGGTASRLKLFSSDGGQVGIGSDNNVPLTFRVNNSERMRLDTNGDLGINTNNPLKRFSVTTGTSDDGIGLYNSSDSIRSLISISSGDDAELGLYNSAGSKTVHLDSDGDSYFTGGDIGIGTTSPASFIEIRQEDSTLLSTQIGSISAMGGRVNIRVRNTSETDGSFSGYELMVENAAGQTQNGLLGIESNSSGFAPDIHLIQRTGSGEQTVRFTIDEDGNVGVGTTSPDTILHLNNDTHGANTTITLTAENDSGTEQTSTIEFDPDTNTLNFDDVTADTAEISTINVVDVFVSNDIGVSGNVEIDGDFVVGGTTTASTINITNGLVVTGQPYVHVYNSGTQYIPNGGAVTTLNFTSTYFDDLNMYSSGNITVPTDGFYIVNVDFEIATEVTADDGAYDIYLRHHTSGDVFIKQYILLDKQTGLFSEHFGSYSGTNLIHASAGDRLHVRSQNNSDKSLGVQFGDFKVLKLY